MTSLDEDWITWLASALPGDAHALTDTSRAVMEMAFFAGASSAVEIARRSGLDAVRAQFAGHLGRVDHLLEQLTAQRGA